MIKTRVVSVTNITSVCKDVSFKRIQRRDNLCIGFRLMSEDNTLTNVDDSLHHLGALTL